MRFDPYIVIPEHIKFLPEEVYVMPCVREYLYRFGKMRRGLFEYKIFDMIMPLFDDNHQDLIGKYLNLGTGEIYDRPEDVLTDSLLENNSNRNYDIYVMENEKKKVSEILNTKRPMTYFEMYEVLSHVEDVAITSFGKGLRKEKLQWQTEITILDEDVVENLVLTRENMISIAKKYILKLKEMERNGAYLITDLYLGYHRPKGEYETSYGWMFLTRKDFHTYQNVVDQNEYEKEDFEELICYSDYLEKVEEENIYPIYDARMCFDKVKKLKK